MFPESHTWHAVSVNDTAKHLHTDLAQGLNEKEVRARLLKFGKNELKKDTRFRLLKIIVAQLMSPLVFVLIVAGVATLFLEEFLDTIVIAVALLVNIVVGAVQEGRASKVFQTLAASGESRTTVIRDGRKHMIPSEELVPGDVVLLENGKSVPADMRLVEAKNLAVNESALTGEWVAVPKSIEICGKDVALVERNNMVWRGTAVTEGYGSGIVVATGQHTEIGKIAQDTQEISGHATPLQRSVRRLARFLMVVIGVSIAGIIVLGLFRGETFAEILLVAIAVAVAAIPSGLPAAVTVILAIGMEAILKQGGLVKNLLAAETLGSTTIILTDKTGTLTEGNMAVAALYTARSIAKHDDTVAHDDNRVLLANAVLASDAFLEEKEGEMAVHGRPIERAVVSAGLEAGISQPDLFAGGYDRLDFLQFESKRRYSTSLNEEGGGARLHFTGAPEQLLERSTHVYVAGSVRELDEETRKEFAAIQRAQSAQGNRFIAVAYKEHKGDTIPDAVRDGKVQGLVFVGLVAFSDTIRADAAQEIEKAKNAGIRVVMVTGDYAETARSVAAKVGIAEENAHVITGRDIEDMEDDELAEAVGTYEVFARVLPRQKLRIARILRSAGEVVAMTGDGVNDAPALVSADIGVAVAAGTDVAKEASDLVLLDNAFSTITAAIKEGRRAVENLRKIVSYLLSTSFSEIILIGGSLAAGAPIPLLPSQILWANLVEEGLMSFPFAFEPAEKGIMERAPRKPQREKTPNLVLSGDTKRIIAIVTVVTGVILLALYFYLRSIGLPIDEIRTIMFVALSLDSIFFAISFKDLEQPVWCISLWNNRFLFVALTVSVLLLIAALTFPPLKTLLSLTALTAKEILLLAALGLANLATIEVTKWWARK